MCEEMRVRREEATRRTNSACPPPISHINSSSPPLPSHPPFLISSTIDQSVATQHWHVACPSSPTLTLNQLGPTSASPSLEPTRLATHKEHTTRDLVSAKVGVEVGEGTGRPVSSVGESLARARAGSWRDAAHVV